jgi:hypothetical protein
VFLDSRYGVCTSNRAQGHNTTVNLICQALLGVDVSLLIVAYCTTSRSFRRIRSRMTTPKTRVRRDLICECRGWIGTLFWPSLVAIVSPLKMETLLFRCTFAIKAWEIPSKEDFDGGSHTFCRF